MPSGLAFEDQAAGLRRLFYSRPCQTIAFVAGGERFGRTSLLTRTALELAGAGERVVVIDEHVGPRSAQARLGVVAADDLWGCIVGEQSNSDVATAVQPNLHVVSAAVAADRLSASAQGVQERLDMILAPVQRSAGFVLIDSRLSHDGELSLLAASAHHVVVVVGAQGGSVTHAYGLIKRLARKRSRECFQLVITRPASAEMARTVFSNLRQTAQQHLGVRIELLAVVGNPAAENLGEELFNRLPRGLLPTAGVAA